MEFSDIERILELVRQHDLAEFELEKDGLKLRVRKAGGGPVFHTGPLPSMPLVPMPNVTTVPPVPALAPAPASSPASTADIDDSMELAVVKSPIVGTFYRSPEPGAAAFVEIGQRVKKDQVLCIIEAMKLMNEITSEYEGEIVSAYVENGKPVQYGERLFAIKTS
ncbi:MAG TPA: acetyl-CoA carboxylase biotin carboxyl carrier protein [Vicinamibacterales bacterium]|jgi:acetyl-CoA carboxylase biotin carboxyl carrier protein|nr:acetyl-CoA carboxylase biotin carboxyl carrier protein [Vicinamibacterales bacterium]